MWEKQENKKLFGAAGALILLAVAGYLFVAFQQRKNTTPPPVPGSFLVAKSAILQGTKTINGKITSISSAGSTGSMDLDTEIFDITSTSSDSIDLRTVPRMVKNITVTWDKTTVFNGKTASELKEGDLVTAVLNQSVYSAEPLTAQSVAFVDPIAQKKAQIMGNVHELFGNVTSVTKTGSSLLLSVSARVVDAKAVQNIVNQDSFIVPYISKTFSITVNANTSIQGKKESEITAGDSLKISVNEDIYTQNNLTANEILYLGPASPAK